MTPALHAVDHLIWATPDLHAGIAAIEAQLGVRATPGGRHPDRGTRNALLGLGKGVYLEILAPDPEEPAPAKPRWLGVDASGPPRLSSWAVKSDDVAGAVARAAASGVGLGAAIAGGRETPDGTKLAWTVSDPDVVLEDGLVPFLIDWGTTPHPAAAAPPGARLVALRAEHPSPDGVHAALAALAIELDVQAAQKPAIIATIETRRGRVELR